MSELRSFPFGSVPIYNPQSLSKGEALAQFHARQSAYESLIALLREDRPSHVLIIGTRGMGKTTLLQRVRYGVEDDAVLNSKYLALVFPEEQYNVNRLHHFLLNTVDALADALEKMDEQQLLLRVEAYAEKVGRFSQEQIEEQVPQFLAEVSQELKKAFLLLVDNADRLFETINDKEQWRLRELLSHRRDLTLFGATTQASEGIYGHDRAFFEFFQIHRLTPLTLAQVRDLLLHLSESVEEEGSAKQKVEKWLASDPTRLRTLVQLTGGNPRTTVLLFHLVLDGLTGSAREYLEQLLDQCTPNYKGRVDELPPQAQQVLDAVALRWDPATAMEVADDTGLETSVVSAQLTRLVRQGLLEKADPGDSKKTLYQVAERFFNIWYLMRASRRVRAKLRWFVEFLRVFFDSTELERMAWERLEQFRNAGRTRSTEIETAFAYVLASGVDRGRFEDYLQKECADSEAEWRQYMNLAKQLESEAVNPYQTNNVSAVTKVSANDLVGLEALQKAVERQPESALNWSLLGNALSQNRDHAEEAERALRKAIELDSSLAFAWFNLGNLLESVPKRWDEAEAAYRNAIKYKPEFASSWYVLGRLLAKMPERSHDAESAYSQALQLDPKLALAWNGLGNLLSGVPGRHTEAEMAHQQAVKLTPQSGQFWRDLGRSLTSNLERREEAERAYRQAVNFTPQSSWFWFELGNLLADMPDRFEEAEASYRKALALKAHSDQHLTLYWAMLGKLLYNSSNRWGDAEAALRKAIGYDPKSVLCWSLLGDLLTNMLGRREEAETAYQQAISIDPQSVDTWVGLSILLSAMPGRLHEAEAAFNEAIKINPSEGSSWRSFGVFLACRAGKPKEAESALRKSLELEPKHPIALRNLGVLLYCEMFNPREAVQLFRQVCQLQPTNSVSAAILTACVDEPASGELQFELLTNQHRRADFWNELLELCNNYRPFAKILIIICDLVQKQDSSNTWVPLYRAVALAQLHDFPRALVALEDALMDDPITQLATGVGALETLFAAAVRSGRVRDCIELLDKKEWKDAWRPIYEALMAVEAGSSEYLKRVAVEIREPALVILRRIAPELPESSAHRYA